MMARDKPWETPDERMVEFGVELILSYEKWPSIEQQAYGYP